MKHYYILVLALVVSGFGFGQINENFDSGLANSYTTGNQTLNSGVWSMTSVFQESTSNSRSGNAARINDDTAEAHLTTPSLNGVGSITFWYRELNNGGGTFEIQTSTDGSNYTTLTTQSYSGSTFTEFNYDINNSNTNLTVRILLDDQAGHLIVDDFSATAFSGGGTDTVVEFVDTSASVSEGVGTTDLTFSIINPDAANATSFDVVLTSGDAADINGYTTQTVTFPANSATDETLTLTITDDGDFEGDETLSFSIQNVTGGTNASVGANSTFDLTIEDNEAAPPVTLITIEDFDNTSPNWANDIADQTFVDPDDPGEGLYIQTASTNNPNFSGNSAFGRDLYGESFEPTLPSPYAFTFESVNISAYSSVQLSFDYYAFANADYGEYEVILDGVGQGAVTYFDDPDISPGVNGTISLSIPNGTTTVALVLTGTLNGGGDVIELDNFKIEGIPFDGLTFQDGMWSPTAPDATTGSDNALIVNGEYVLQTDVSLNDVYVNPGAAVTVPSGTTLTVSSLNLESVSDSYSSLISNGTINGTLNYSRYVNEVGSGASEGNDLVSPPLTGQTWSDFLSNNTANLVNDGNTAPTTYGFGPFDKLATPNAGFVNYDSDTNIALLSGVGYRSATVSGANLVFTGTVPASPVTAAITQAGSGFELWNLIGNPFPSYITLEAFLAANNDQFEETSSGVYGYDGTNYEIYNQGFSDLNPGFLIAPGQGFFVASVALGGSVSFTNAMRSAGSTDDFIAERSANTAAISNLKIQINTSESAFDTDFYFTPNATRGLDPGYDSSLFGNTAPAFSIYSHLVEDNTGLVLAVQSLTHSDLTDVVVPLGVNANQGAQLTFSITASTLPSGIEVFLEDNVANTITLLNSADYTLTPHTELNGTGRFFLRFTNSVLSAPQNTFDGLNIYTNQANKTIIIAGQLSTTTNASIYDLQGRLVTTKTLDSDSRTQAIDVAGLSTGIYIVTIENSGIQRSQKVILR